MLSMSNVLKWKSKMELDLEFDSANDAYKFYYINAANIGFKIKIGQLFRSNHDG